MFILPWRIVVGMFTVACRCFSIIIDFMPADESLVSASGDYTVYSGIDGSN